MPRTKEQAHKYYLKSKSKWENYNKKSHSKPEVKAKRIAYTQEWRKRNPDKINATAKQRLADGRAYKSIKKYAVANPDKIKTWRKKTYWKHREKRLAEHRIYYQANKEKLKKYIKAYRQTSKGKDVERKSSIKCRSTIHGHLRHNVSAAVSRKLANHGGKKYRASIDKILPFGIPDLIKKLESMFKPGMTWDNYGDWHLDHIIPDCNFKYTTFNCLGFKQSWALSNLQPLWASENCSKGKRLI